ncbi:SRPBCC family protein [Salinarchaeum laminariae]|uniref:SRPBCC family protein n=1 Tax=Salinarchaeum laminariae TaxID=869888 RepID=UPI0020BE90F5|nr:SRPBCC family protein [Salinarchaeum laminariae]
MRTVEVSQFVQAPPGVVERALDPASIVEHEGSFEVRHVEERDGDVHVVAGGAGLELSFRFELRENGIFYEQIEDEGAPLETMETDLSWRSENEGTRIDATSTVSMGVRPRTITDRIAGWKRRGELRRALSSVSDAVG